MKKMLFFIYGAARGLFIRLRLSIACFRLPSKARGIVRMTGIGNCETNVRIYPSVLHFLHNVPALFRRKGYDYLIAQNFLHDKFLSCQKPKVFFTFEPPAYMTPETVKNMRSERMREFLYLYDEPDIRKRMFYPCLGNHKEEIIRHLERSLTGRRLKFCCIINRYSEHPGLNLLKQRVLFVKAMGDDIDIYGAEPYDGPNKWTAFKGYRGMTADKQQTLREYNFVIAFENCDHPGYVTEKIFDAFRAGTVPLYWGGGKFLRETVPPHCYIDCRNQDPGRIFQMIKDMKQEEIISFRKAAADFLKSDAADRFTVRYFKRELLRRMQVMD